MIVVISDLHLTDGTTGKTISAGAFRLFRNRLSDMAYDASWRPADNNRGRIYRPIESLDLILLGDVLDIIRSTGWTEDPIGSPKYARPWSDPRSEAFIHKIDDIVERILVRNKDSLKILHDCAKENAITIPPATRSGQVDSSVAHNLDAPGRLPVTIRIHYVVGNHDWFLGLEGEAFDRIREKVIEVIGLSNDRGPFPHSLTDSDTLIHLCRTHHLFWRHGDEFDPFNFDIDKGRNVASLGDALVVELFNRFPDEVEKRLGDLLPTAAVEDLKELANIYPELVAPIWINGVLVQRGVKPSLIHQVKEIWNELAKAWIKNPFVREYDTPKPWQSVDLVQMGLLLSTWMSLEAASRLAVLIYRFWPGLITFRKQALADAETHPWAKVIIYGHTHKHEIVPLDITTVNNQPSEQIYINSGTWHEYHQLTIRHLLAAKFVTFKRFTYIAVYKKDAVNGDERLGRDYEVWTGTLDS